MTAGSVVELDEWIRAWREFEALIPVKLRAIASDRHFRAMVKFMNELVDRIGDQENHPLMGLLDVVTAFVYDYEEQNVEIPNSNPSVVLRFLMDPHGLRQTSLARQFGSQSKLSDLLHRKLEINADQALALAKRFGVSAELFI